MRRATLVVNPSAGKAGVFEARWPTMRAVLEAAGYGVEVALTTPAGLTPEAGGAASDLVVACGGDGTVHAVVQALAFGKAVLGVIPLGTANALARNLGLPLDPVEALQRLLTYVPVRVPLGTVERDGKKNYFAVMAGCGPDGALVYSLTAAEKARFGRAAYYAHAARLFCTRRWPAFEVAYRVGGEWRNVRAVAVMAARVPDLGGVFGRLTARASLTSERLRLHVLRAPAQVSMPAWFGLSRVGVRSPWVLEVEAEEVRCAPLRGELEDAQAVYSQVDGEPWGRIPFVLGIEVGALRLLMPPVRGPGWVI